MATFFLVPADGSFIHSYFNLIRTATSPQLQQSINKFSMLLSVNADMF